MKNNQRTNEAHQAYKLHNGRVFMCVCECVYNNNKMSTENNSQAHHSIITT